MREPSFLVTNDDGIESPLLATLVAALRPLGQVIVVAPASENSWIGKAISRRQQLKARRRDELFGCTAWAIDGTPADAVNLGLGNLVDGGVDLVVSGINMGSNAGIPLILASGTVGGALEGALHGLHAVATSIRVAKADWEVFREGARTLAPHIAATAAEAARRTAELCASLACKRKPRRFLVHNLNFPPETRADTPLERTMPALFQIGTLWTPAPNAAGEYAFTFAVGDERRSRQPTDRSCLDAGKATYSVLDFGRIGVSALRRDGRALRAPGAETRDAAP